MHRAIRIVSAAFVGMAVLMGSNFAVSSGDDRSEILKAIADLGQGHGGVRAAPPTMDQSRLAH